MLPNRIKRPEARVLAETEFVRFAELAKSLTDKEWASPTDCTGWDVRKMALHVLGSGDAQALDIQHRAAHALRLRRGLAISSSPTVRKNRPRNTVRITTVGATHHHHQPLIIAALKLTQ